MSAKGVGRYAQIIERLFFDNYVEGSEEVAFSRDQIRPICGELGIAVPDNLGDIVYTFRFRQELPESIRAKAPPGTTWIIRLSGAAQYRFSATTQPFMVPNEHMGTIRIPDSTPGVITLYAQTDEQALLARLRYNRMLDIFTGVSCYSLQSHLRTQVPELGQTETDELYLGVDKYGAHYIFPVQAKGGRDKLSIVQIEQDLVVCTAKFPHLICRPIAAQFMRGGVIALFGFEAGANGEARLFEERHYQLVPAGELTSDELESYRSATRYAGANS